MSADARPHRTVLTLCCALMLSMGGIATFPAVLPEVRDAWGLSNTAAGWITGSYHAGYMLSVPVLASLSDRVDARKILIYSLVVASSSSAAFALAAGGLWSALACQVAGGAALAGVYMPGLKGLADRTAGPRVGRYISFYTASFTVGTSLSFLIAGAGARWWGWRFAFGAAALEQALAAVLVLTMLSPAAPASERQGTAPHQPWGGIRRRFAPVFQSRRTMDYIWGYGAHMWELFALRSWLVPFLTFALSRQPAAGWSAPALAAFVTILGVPASIGGQEVASRAGVRRFIRSVMIAAVVLSVLAGWTALLPFGVALAACSLYSIAVSADSAPLTAAAMAAAPAGYRGAAMAVHSTVGFTAASLGTLAVGATLDVLGGDTQLAWGVAFAVMGLTGVLGAWRLWGTGEGDEVAEETLTRRGM